jgi:hypothetical protein
MSGWLSAFGFCTDNLLPPRSGLVVACGVFSRSTGVDGWLEELFGAGVLGVGDCVSGLHRPLQTLLDTGSVGAKQKDEL